MNSPPPYFEYPLAQHLPDSYQSSTIGSPLDNFPVHCILSAYRAASINEGKRRTSHLPQHKSLKEIALMYLKALKFINYGPITSAALTPRLSSIDTPVPLAVVGANGSG